MAGWCAEHKEEMSLYCMDDNQLICLLCAGTSHANHAYEALETAQHKLLPQVKNSLKELVRSLDSPLPMHATQTQTHHAQTHTNKHKHTHARTRTIYNIILTELLLCAVQEGKWGKLEAFVKEVKEKEHNLAVDAERKRKKAKEEIDKLRKLLDEKEKEIDHAITSVHTQRQHSLDAKVTKAKAALEKIPGTKHC